MSNPTTTTTIHISRDDYAKLRLLLTAALRSNPSATLQKLREELDRALVLDPAAIPANVVTMGSTVEFEDLGDGSVEHYTITFPDRADIEQRRLSVLAPIGTALIGYRTGDVVNWTTPGGVRQLRILRVTPPEPSVTGPTVVPPFSLAPTSAA